MCGIAGFVDCSASSLSFEAQISGMLRSIHSRGPDEKGVFLEENLALGIARLKIIDLVTGSQPVFSEDRRLVVVFNGEIYNFRELRKELEAKGHRFSTNGDTEVLVHLYEEHGEAMCPYLNGMFAFALYDRREKKLFIARDRIGIKPLYYYHDGKNFGFASELKALLKLPFFKKELDYTALVQYLVMEYVPSPMAIFKNARKLDAGHYLVYQGNKIRAVRWWDVPEDRAPYRDFEEVKEHFLSLLDDSVKRRLVSDVPIGVFLSGGIDSSSITCFAHRHVPEQLHTFSIGFDDPSFDERPYIDMIREKFPIQHHDRLFGAGKMVELLDEVFAYLDEPFADASILPTFMLSRFARESITVALGGDGGDELFAGYPTYQAHRLAAFYSLLPGPLKKTAHYAVDRLPVSLKNFSFDFKAKKFLSGMDYPPLIRNFIWLGSFSEKETGELLSGAARKEAGGHDPFGIVRETLAGRAEDNVLEQVLYLDLKLYLQNDILVKVDRASMANSLEVRVPFLDFRIVEFISRLPLKYKLNFFTTKYILKKSMRGLLPDRIIRRQKKGFGIPAGRWIKTELKGLADSLLDSSKIRKEGIFDAGLVRRLLEEHWEGRRDNRKKLWTLMAFELWLKHYFS